MQAVALIGSWARGMAGADSDVDVVIVTNRAELYVSTDDWAATLGMTELSEPRAWGVLTARRGIAASVVDVEFGITTVAWADVEPLDPGTRRVVSDGMKVIYDPKGILGRLIRAAR